MKRIDIKQQLLAHAEVSQDQGEPLSIEEIASLAASIEANNAAFHIDVIEQCQRRLNAVREFVNSDSLASSFQSLGQYRKALTKAVNHGWQCAKCSADIGLDNGPKDGWQLENGITVCQACCIGNNVKLKRILPAHNRLIRQTSRAITAAISNVSTEPYLVVYQDHYPEPAFSVMLDGDWTDSILFKAVDDTVTLFKNENFSGDILKAKTLVESILNQPWSGDIITTTKQEQST